jgi:hypothetical protein
VQPQMDTDGHRSARAFTLTELLVLMGVLAVLVAVRLPAMCRAETPVQLLQCLSNCRQIGAAVLLYRSDYGDAFPFGHRVSYGTQVTDSSGWPMLLLRYLGGYKNAQPKVYVCPSETGFAGNWVFQLHYQANRYLISDLDDRDTATCGGQVQRPESVWLFIEKGPWDFASVRPGGLLNPVLATWNVPPGCPQYRRHSGGMTATAADGHADWLRVPPYQPGRAAPASFWELGMGSTSYPGGGWDDDSPPIAVKLYAYWPSGPRPGF